MSADLVLDLTGGLAQKIAVSSTSAQSAALTTPTVVLHTDVDVYVRQGSNPTAVSDGTDIFVPSGAYVRLVGIQPGNKLAFKTASASGSVHLTPGA